MSRIHPYLTNGRQSNQSIHQVAQSGTGSIGGGAHQVGTRAQLEDGRVFYYARSSGAAIGAGVMLQMPDVAVATTANAIATEVAGVVAVSVDTTTGYTGLENEYAGGYVCVTNDTGEGQTLPIKSHLPFVDDAIVVCNIEGTLPLTLAAGTVVTLLKNPWGEVVISGANQDHFAVGISNVAVPAGTTNPQHFWCQTWGVASVWQDATTANGSKLASGSTAGQVEISGADGDQDIGQVLHAVATIADYTPTFLTIAP
jgi:hypothetical protein